MRWFEQLFGFPERPWQETQSRFSTSGTTLTSLENNRSFEVGRFATPSLSELRQDDVPRGSTRKLVHRHRVIGDALLLHALPENEGAMFQAASQFNCLEFAGPEELPEDGVTQYDDDPTQGPACSLAAGAATVMRNYFIDVGGSRGQQRDRQLNNLDDVQQLLGAAGQHIQIRNGYSFSTAGELKDLNAALAQHDRDTLRAQLKIGVHAQVGVTFASRFQEPARPQRVSQAFCSAISCGYTGGSKDLWAPLASLVLEAAYEATLRAAAKEQQTGSGSGVVWLTFLGGGVFANDSRWIAAAIGRALRLLADWPLDVQIAHYRNRDETMVRLIDEAAAGGSKSF